MNVKIIALTVGIIAGAGIGGVWYGDQPKVTYYPNGKVHTSVQRKFFKETGNYTIYNQDGTVSQQYNMVDGVKNGEGVIYAGGASIKVNYVNGKLSGAMKIDTHNNLPELEKADISADNNIFSFAQKEDGAKIKIESKLICEEEQFFENLQKFAEVKNIETFTKVAECLDVYKASVDDEEYACKYDGSFIYPKFNKDTNFVCDDKSGDLVGAYAMIYGLEDIGKVQISFDYDVKTKTFAYKIADSNKKYEQTQNFKGIDEVIPDVTEFAFSKQENKDIVKLISSFLNKFVSQDSSMQLNGRKVFDSVGEFNIMNGFSDQWKATFYGFDDKPSTQLKITDKGTVLTVSYPISGKPMISFGMKFNDKFKVTYKNLLKNVLKEFSENSEDVAMANIMGELPNYAMELSDVLDSVNGLLFNNKGEKIIGGVATIKKGTEFATFMTSPEEAVRLKIISYKDNKAQNVIDGDMANGFMVNGQKIFESDIEKYIDKDAIDATMKDIENEVNQVKSLMESGKYTTDPLMMGFYSGYFKAMDKYKDNKIVDQISMIIVNIRSLYAAQGNYSGLNSKKAIETGVIPNNMVENNTIVHAFGGVVNVSSSQLLSDEEQQEAFVVQFTNLPQEVCENLVDNAWEFLAEDGFVAMGVNTDLTKVYADECEDIPGVVCGIQDIQLMPDCMRSGNIVSYKFK